MLFDLRLSMNKQKVISNLMYPEDLPMYYLYKFFEGLIQGDGLLEEGHRLSFAQSIELESHQQILYQGWFSGLLLGFSIHTKLGTKKNESGAITRSLKLSFKGKSHTIMESEGLKKKRYPLLFNERKPPVSFSFIPLQTNEITNKEMYFFDVDHTSFITTEGLIFQNSDTNLFAARMYDSDNSFKFQYQDDYKTLHSTVMRRLLDYNYDDYEIYLTLITKAENIVTEIAGNELKNIKDSNFKCSHCSYRGTTKPLYEQHISRCNPKQVAKLYMDPFFYSSVHDPIDCFMTDEEQYSFIIGELESDDDQI